MAVTAAALETEDEMKGPKGKYAWTATVGERGQIVIPKQARELFGILPGDTLLLLGDARRGIAIPPRGSFNSLLEKVFAESLAESEEASDDESDNISGGVSGDASNDGRGE